MYEVPIMETNKTFMLRVGIFITIGLIILVWFSLKAESPTKVKGGYELFTRFEQVKGIESGTMVTMSGVEIGKVDKISFDDTSDLVHVGISVKGDIKIRKDSIATINIKSLLGQNIINIKPGTKTAGVLQPGEEIKSKESYDMDKIIEVVGDLGDNAKELVKNFNENQNGLMNKISDVIDENRDNLKATTKSFAEVGPKLNSVLSDVQDVVSDIKGGKGTIGKLVTDDSVYEDFSKVSKNLAEISDKVKSGEGSLGKFINDDSIHNSATETMELVKGAAKEIKSFLNNNQQGVTDVIDALKQSAPKIQKASENLAEITNKVNNGEGTLGKLVNDPTLYNDAKEAVTQIKQTFQENEEQTVMRTFLGIVFGSMM